jgi:uncharacterized protein HemX
MVTKEELKKEVDKLPDSLLDEVYILLKNMLRQKKSNQESMYEGWDAWRKNLEQFSSDFMNSRNQSSQQSRESFD